MPAHREIGPYLLCTVCVMLSAVRDRLRGLTLCGLPGLTARGLSALSVARTHDGSVLMGLHVEDCGDINLGQIETLCCTQVGGNRAQGPWLRPWRELV